MFLALPLSALFAPWKANATATAPLPAALPVTTAPTASSAKPANVPTTARGRAQARVVEAISARLEKGSIAFDERRQVQRQNARGRGLILVLE